MTESEEMTEGGRRLERLVSNIAAINSRKGLEEVLEEVIRSAADLIRAEAASILLTNPITGLLDFHTAVGSKSREVKTFHLEMGDGIAGWTAKHGETVIVNDTGRDPRYRADIAERIGFEARAIIAVPLDLKGRTIGAVEVINPTLRDGFDGDDAWILKALADQAAIAIENARYLDRLSSANTGYKSLLRAATRFEDIISGDESFKSVLDVARRVATSDATVLIKGESGTGKEMVAQAIHNASLRSAGPFIAVSCAAIPDQLLESELFGHEKGAFTGATGRKAGRLEIAEGGTLFLDEIGEMPLSLQAKILRALQEKTISHLGGTEDIPVDARVIAATNRDLEAEVKEGRFREDLYYRLAVIPITLPPLRERPGDIMLLAEYFRERACRTNGRNVRRISASSRRAILDHSWPGNARELENVMERAVILAEGEEITPDELMLSSVPARGELSQGLELKEAVALFRKKYIRDVLDSCGGNRTRAARALGIQRTYLSRLAKDLDG